MTMPSGSDPSGYDITGVDGPFVGAGFSALVGRTQDSVMAQKKTEVQGFGLSLSLLGKGNNGHFAPFAWAA